MLSTTTAVTWLKYWWYGVKHDSIIQSLNYQECLNNWVTTKHPGLLSCIKEGVEFPINNGLVLWQSAQFSRSTCTWYYILSHFSLNSDFFLYFERPCTKIAKEALFPSVFFLSLGGSKHVYMKMTAQATSKCEYMDIVDLLKISWYSYLRFAFLFSELLLRSTVKAANGNLTSFLSFKNIL